jgi:hypothetical protein
MLRVPFLSVSRSDQLFLPVEAVDDEVVDCVGLVVDWVVVVVLVGAVCDCMALESACVALVSDCVVDE